MSSRDRDGRLVSRGHRPERPLVEHLTDYAGLMLTNLLWLVSSLPLVTLPAASAGLAAVTGAWARSGRRPDVVAVFFGAARRQFGRAWLVVLLDLVAAAPLVLNVLIVQRADAPDPLLLAARGASLAGLAFLAAFNVVLWPSLESGGGLGDLLRRAATAVLLRPQPCLLTVAAATLVLGAGLLLPRFVFLFVSVASAAYVASWGVSRIEGRTPMQEATS